MDDAIRFYFDEHIATLVTIGLRQRGVDVLTADEAGRSGIPDPDQLAFAAAEERVMVTFDADICNLRRAEVRMPESPIAIRQNTRRVSCCRYFWFYMALCRAMKCEIMWSSCDHACPRIAALG